MLLPSVRACESGGARCRQRRQPSRASLTASREVALGSQQPEPISGGSKVSKFLRRHVLSPTTNNMQNIVCQIQIRTTLGQYEMERRQ